MSFEEAMVKSLELQNRYLFAIILKDKNELAKAKKAYIEFNPYIYLLKPETAV